METMSDRHEGNAGGVLRPFQETEPIRVTVVVTPEAASDAAVQHTAWMLVNLLTRLIGVVDVIGFLCPKGVPQNGRIVPLACPGLDFGEAVLVGAQAIGGVRCVPDNQPGPTLFVGPEGRKEVWLNVYGAGWNGGISTDPIPGICQSRLPFGPYIAACLGAGEVFRAARFLPDLYEPAESAFLSAWDYAVSGIPGMNGPATLPEISMDVLLAGVGAVGCAWIHCLWACDDMEGIVQLADGDTKGLTLSNLNRYCLFGQESLGKYKASEAARVAGASRISWQPYDTNVEDITTVPPRVVSAVDTNIARMGIQVRYPARIISASTSDLRAEVLRCGPPGRGACLRCFNPPERQKSDDDLRSLMREQPDMAAQVAAEQGVRIEEVEAWARTGQCGETGARTLSWLRRDEAMPTRFAVGFVSVLAGIFAAGETIKDIMGAEVPLTDTMPRAVFQFVTPRAPTNRFSSYARDPACPVCHPETPAAKIWTRKFNALSPARP